MFHKGTQCLINQDSSIKCQYIVIWLIIRIAFSKLGFLFPSLGANHWTFCVTINIEQIRKFGWNTKKIYKNHFYLFIINTKYQLFVQMRCHVSTSILCTNKTKKQFLYHKMTNRKQLNGNILRCGTDCRILYENLKVIFY